MRINEIFYSLQGEGTLACEPTVFVRLQGCNLRCGWCDTIKAQDCEGGKEWNIADIVQKVRYLLPQSPLENLWVCITGGEPLTQQSELAKLVAGLKQWSYRVTIETNGSLPPPHWYRFVNSWVADCKCPSSGEFPSFDIDWTDLRSCDQVKFVVADERDLKFVQGILCSKLFTPKVIVSPILELENTTWCRNDGELPAVILLTSWQQRVAEFCKEHRLRMSMQQHKFIWGIKEGV